MLLDYFFPERGKCRAKYYCGLTLVTVLYFITRASLIGQIGIEVGARDYVRTLYGVIGSYAYYFTMLLLPLFQSATPVINASSFSVSSFAIILCLSALAILCRKRFKELSFAILWVTISLIPVCGIIPLSIPAQEHRLYLGTVCFSMMLPLASIRLSCLQTQTKKINKAIALVILPAVLIFYTAKTVARNSVWENELSFWTKTVHDSPGSSVATSNLGVVYARAGEHQIAIREFQKALALTNQGNMNAPGRSNIQ
jgi:tetratricopeptide (TPR) repeat protein